MMMYQVDAFAQHVFLGNPAAVVILKDWLSDELMQNIAKENNLSETSFVKMLDEQNYEIRWFSPVKEVGFCGYGTLASSFMIFSLNPNIRSIRFKVKDLGDFYIDQAENGLISMNLPVQIPEVLLYIPPLLKEALNQEFAEVYVNPQAYIVVYPSIHSVITEQPNFEKIKQLGGRRVAITTSVGLNEDALNEQYSDYDIVSRYFTPSMGIDEDPVTGSLHTSLVPLWSSKLNHNKIVAFQASQRGGVLYCQLKADGRVQISGYCKLFMKAELNLND